MTDPQLSAPAGAEPIAQRRPLWLFRVAEALFALFCLEVGAFLIVYPWSGLWDVNRLSYVWEAFRPVWLSPYFRGAITGLGVLNVWIGVTEALAMRRALRASTPGGGEHPVE